MFTSRQKCKQINVINRCKNEKPKANIFCIFHQISIKTKKANFHYGEFILNIEEPNYNIGKFERQNFYYVYA